MVIIFYLLCLVLLGLGFLVYYLITGQTPIEYWTSIDGTPAGTVLTVIFGLAIVAVSISFAIKMVVPPRR